MVVSFKNAWDNWLYVDAEVDEVLDLQRPRQANADESETVTRFRAEVVEQLEC